MIHIHIANQSKQTLGGGFIFIENLKKGATGKAKFVDHWKDAHAVLIPSCTMTTRQDIQDAKAAKKKILLRIDNMPKESRNRGTAFSRMKDYAQLADVIIFQSNWAKEYVGSWLEMAHKIDLKNAKVIYNGVDTEFFYHRDDPKKRGETYLYTTFNTDENKRFPEAAYDFYLRNLKAIKENTHRPTLKLVGEFGKHLPEYKFDFFNGEKFSYTPPISDRKAMGEVYRSCRYIYFPAFADAAPNTVSEAVACGCEVLLMNPIGGTKEVVEQFTKRVITIQECADDYLRWMR
jgi:glycosyltransferase involved in cell wall biosynthesis